MNSEYNSILEQILVHKKNLNDLEIKKAKFGSLDVPVYILRQIEDEKEEINRLEKEVKKINNEKKRNRQTTKRELENQPLSTSSKSHSKNWKLTIPILVAVIGLTGTSITAYVNYITQRIPIEATQTAEAKATLINSSSVAPLATETERSSIKSGQVRGKIISADTQNPVADLFLILAPAESAPYGQVGLEFSPSSPRTTTNSIGEFIFLNVPIGKYVLLAGGMQFVGIVDPSGFMVFEIITNEQVVNLGLLAVMP